MVHGQGTWSGYTVRVHGRGTWSGHRSSFYCQGFISLGFVGIILQDIIAENIECFIYCTKWSAIHIGL